MKRALALAGIAVLCLVSAEAEAHYCSNIFSGPARFIVKPETTTLAVTGSTQLRVYLQNNFPYTLFSVQLRGQASGFTITSSPSSRTIHPGQNVSYVLTITGTGTASMTMQMLFRLGTWRGPTDKLVNQNPTQSSLVSGAVYGAGTAEQSPSLNLGKLADLYASATLGSGAPTFSRTGMQQLIKMFGYRYCWDEGGSWVGGTQDCPSPSAEATWGSPNDTSQWPQDCMRAGVEIAVRKAALGSNLAAAQNGAVNALKGAGSAAHKCLAAVVGGYLWQGASDASPFTSALSLAANSVPTVCQTAGLRALGTNNTNQTCPTSPFVQAAACAAGEGLRNNDSPVTSILMPNAGDGASSSGSDWTSSLYYAYMLYLVQGVRRATGGTVPFYPDAGGPIGGCSGPGDCNDNNVCTTDACNAGTCSNTAISGCCTTNTQCNDNNACTTDTCNTTTNTCSNAAISGCCTTNGQCNDSNVCTTDTCNTTTHVCAFAPITNCCTTNTQCNDNVSCTTDTCNTTTNTCVFTPQTGCCTSNAACNDNNPCTTDTCTTATGVCSNTPVASCCTSNGQCNDNNICTTDSCNTTSNTCTFAPVANCCTSNAGCNDNNVCTTDSCNTTNNTCTFAPISGCCTTNATCSDSNVCTADTCNPTSHTCQFTNITGCCTTNAQCSDGSNCTNDTCNTTSHTCEHAPVAGCCTTSADCADTNPCTDDTCNTANGTCSNTPRTGCCAFDVDCDDTNACTLDTCDTTTNTCTHAQTCVDQGVVPSDAGTGDRNASVDRSAAPNGMLVGGCSVPGAGHSRMPGAVLVVVVLLIFRRRR